MEQAGEYQDPSLRSASIKIYRTGASAEDVVNFYLQKIGGKEGAAWEGDPSALAKGGTSPVSLQVWYYDEEDLTDWTYEGPAHPGKWMKETLAKNRKPVRPGMWIKEAQFSWIAREQNDDMTSFYLDILDTSFGDPVDYPSKKFKTGTRIEVQVSTSKSEAVVREESEEQMERQVEARAKALKGNPPTEKDLGVPIYPGATFDAESSAGMSAGNDYSMYLYLSGDQPAKVAAFYEQKLKKKAVQAKTDTYVFPLKGEMPIPEEGITIEPNTMFGGQAKTVITILKMACEQQ